MNAVTAMPHPSLVERAAATPHQRQLISELARARTKLAGLAGDLRAVEKELEALKPQRKQHLLAVDACKALEKLAEMGGAEVFWGDGPTAQQGTEHIRGVRERVSQFDARVSGIEQRQDALMGQLQRQGDLVDAIEHELFEAQEEEDLVKYEWPIERELNETPRKLVMPWTREGEEDKRFRKSVATALLLVVVFTALVPYIPLPVRVTADGTVIPERVVRLLIEERPPPPTPPKEEPKPKVQEKPIEVPQAQPAPQRVAKVEPKKIPEAPIEPEAKEEGILAFRSKLSAAKNDEVVGRLGLQARIDNSDYNSSGRTERSMLTTSAPGSSGGINLASLSRNTGGGNGGGGMAGVQVTRASSAIAAVGTPGGDRPLSGDSASAGRTDEEIQIVFDRYKAALYRLYNRELRKDPTLKGQIVLHLTILPDGSVSLCELKSTDMNAPELVAQVIERVKGFDFGAKAVPAITIFYPIDFLPTS